jgi:Lon protease-like protein
MPSLPLVVRSRVLLPRQRLQLRINDRKAAAALSGHAGFGAVFSARTGDVSDVGVEALILAQSDAPNDRLDVEVVGGRRFRLGAEPVGAGELTPVDYLDEPPGPGDVEVLREELQRGWRRFAAAATESGRTAAIHARLHADPVIASYQAATLLPLLHPERQELLEVPTTSERLERLAQITAGETGLLRHMLATGRMGA